MAIKSFTYLFISSALSNGQNCPLDGRNRIVINRADLDKDQVMQLADRAITAIPTDESDYLMTVYKHLKKYYVDTKFVSKVSANDLTKYVVELNENWDYPTTLELQEIKRPYANLQVDVYFDKIDVEHYVGKFNVKTVISGLIIKIDRTCIEKLEVLTSDDLQALNNNFVEVKGALTSVQYNTDLALNLINLLIKPIDTLVVPQPAGFIYSYQNKFYTSNGYKFELLGMHPIGGGNSDQPSTLIVTFNVAEGSHLTIPATQYEVPTGSYIRIENNMLYINDDLIPVSIDLGYIMLLEQVDETIYTLYTNPITYYINFESGNNHAVGTAEMMGCIYDEYYTLIPNPFVIEDYVDGELSYHYDFVNWQDSDGNVYADQQVITNLTTEDGKMVTLTAIWNVTTTNINPDINPDELTDCYVGYIPSTNSENMTSFQQEHISQFANYFINNGLLIPTSDTDETLALAESFLPKTLDEVKAMPTVLVLTVENPQVIASIEEQDGVYPHSPVAFYVINENLYKLDSIITFQNGQIGDGRWDDDFNQSIDLGNGYKLYYYLTPSAIICGRFGSQSYRVSIKNK